MGIEARDLAVCVKTTRSAGRGREYRVKYGSSLAEATGIRHRKGGTRAPNGKVFHRALCTFAFAHEPPDTAVADCEVLVVPVVPVVLVVAVVPVVPVEPDVALVAVVPELVLAETLLLFALALAVVEALWPTNMVMAPAIATLPRTAREVVALMIALPLRRDCMGAP